MLKFGGLGIRSYLRSPKNVEIGVVWGHPISSGDPKPPQFQHFLFPFACS